MASGSAKVAHLTSSESFLTSGNSTAFVYNSIAEAFPEVAPLHRPVGDVCLFQIRMPKRRSGGGIIVPDEARSTEYYNTQVAKVIAVGPTAFKSRSVVNTEDGPKSQLLDWQEGAWFKPGDFVRVPKYGGDRFSIPYAFEDFEVDPSNGKREKLTVRSEVVFALFRAGNIICAIDGDPMTIKSFLD